MKKTSLDVQKSMFRYNISSYTHSTNTPTFTPVFLTVLGTCSDFIFVVLFYEVPMKSNSFGHRNQLKTSNVPSQLEVIRFLMDSTTTVNTTGSVNNPT